jgi:mono/diheme cytochrome c family protein
LPHLLTARQGRAIALRQSARQPHRQRSRRHQPDGHPARLLTGWNAPLPVEHAFMPPFARGHSDDDLAAVANFVNGFFGNGTTKVTAADIGKAQKALP